MAEPILMPKAGQTMEEGTIVSWLKKEGDQIKKGEPVMVIQTDKADVEVEAPASGVLKAILVPEGEVVPVLSPVGVIAAPGEEVDLQKFKAQTPSGAAPQPEEKPVEAPPPPPPEAEPAASAPAASVRATPTAKKLAELRGLDLSGIQGTGVGGRITRQDVEEAAATGGRVAASPVARRLAERLGVDLRAVRGTGPQGRIIKRDVEHAASAAPAPAPAPDGDGARVVELTGMRKAIASALQLSKQQAPHFYATLAVDMTRAMAYRAYLKETGRKVTVNDLVLRAAVLALQEHPKVNCRIEDNRVTYYQAVHLGVAVGLDEGLVVPVIVNAQNYDLFELSRESKRVTQAARQGRLIGTGKGTFTVSNLGMFGIERFSAIINPPEGAILAVGAVNDELVVEGQSFSIRKVMRLTVSADHRVIDGVLAAKFLVSVKKYLENPESLAGAASGS